jgi:hypothetical protein
MKKNKIPMAPAILGSMMLFGGISLIYSGCNACDNTVKNLQSNWTNLPRDITVINALRGDTIFKYSGPCYITDESGKGDITLIYKVNGTSKKADFLGDHVIFIAVEK